jgi:hypothetical protein
MQLLIIFSDGAFFPSNNRLFPKVLDHFLVFNIKSIS